MAWSICAPARGGERFVATATNYLLRQPSSPCRSCEYTPPLDQGPCSIKKPARSTARRDRRTGGPSIHRPDHIRDRVGIDPFDDTRIHVSHLKQRRKPGVASTSLAEEHLPHPPIPLIKLVSSDDHKVPWADAEKGSLRLHREITVINRHEPPRNQYTCTHSHGDAGLASRQSRWR